MSSIHSNDYSFTKEILSNEMFTLTGDSSDVWIISVNGLNVTTDITENPVQWTGIKNLFCWNMASGGGYALGRTTLNGYNDFDKTGKPTPLWFAPINNLQSYKLLNLPFNAPVGELSYQMAEAIYYENAFWMACMDGGIVRLNPADQQMETFAPVKDPNVHIDSYDLHSLDFSQGKLWIAGKKALWMFDSSATDKQWTKIEDSVISVDYYSDLRVRSTADSNTILFVTAIDSINESSSDTTIYTYDVKKNKWATFLKNAGRYVSFSFGHKNEIYLLDNKLNRIRLFNAPHDQITNDLTKPFGVEITQIGQKSVDYASRVNNAEGAPVGSILSEIRYVETPTDTLLQISSSEGLFYSNNERADNINGTPFTLVRRFVPIESELKKTYAYPGILLAGTEGKDSYATFAYNLAEDDDVTIDIFDYNMDHVIRIVDKAPRKAGKNTPQGRSTNLKEDRWNGTFKNRSGSKTVAPGVYYFRIKTEKGNRSFGKIIVAKS